MWPVASRPQEEGLLFEKFTTGLLKSFGRPHQSHPVPTERIHPKTLNPPTPEKALARSLGQRYNFHKKGAFSQLGFRLHRKLRKLILPSSHFTLICC